MRIFCAVRHSHDPRRFYGGLWSGNFYPALWQLGHEIVESNSDLLPASGFMEVAGDFTPQEREVRARTTERILAEVRAARQQGPVHLFLSYFYNSHFDPAGYDVLRQLGIPSINFFCNSIYQFDLVAAVAAKVDFSWHAEKLARASYLKVGARPVWVQMGADPEVYHPMADAVRAPKACFVGQRYADRDRWVLALVRGGVPVDVFGSGWIPGAAPPAAEQVRSEYLGRPKLPAGGWGSMFQVVRDHVAREGIVAGLARTSRQWAYRRQTRQLTPLLLAHARGRAADIATTLASYALCLNFSNVWADGRPGSALIPHVRLRDFEAPMCRTCYLTGHTDEIEEFYEVGKEIETYRKPEELVDKTRFYLKNPTQAERLREAGYRRATRDHTWARRFEELFGKLGMSK